MPAEAPATALMRVIARLPHGLPTTIDGDLVTAFAAAASPNALRALGGDLRAYATWCRKQHVVGVPATPALIAAYLQARDDAGAAPASLSRYKASLARLHSLLGLPDPTRDPLVTLKLRAIRRAKGSVQRQARPLRFKGAVRDIYDDAPRGVSLAAILDSCVPSPGGVGAGGQGGLASVLPAGHFDDVIAIRDAALLSVAYDTGLRAAELVALRVEDLLPAIDIAAGLVAIRRSKGDQEGEGATAYLSPRSMRALNAWRVASTIDAGALFRRVFARRMSAKAAVARQQWARVDEGRLRVGRLPATPAVAAHTVYTVGTAALTSGAVTGVYRRALARAFAAGALPDLNADEFAGWVAGVSAHSTRVGLTQDLFSAGEDLAGIMDALRWKTARMPLLYNRNLAAESGAAGRVVSRL